MRVAIYARVSTDKQSSASVEDQVARCREWASAHEAEVNEELIFMDDGISGASIEARPALRRCLDAIGEWDVLVCWEFSRLARDEGHLADIRGELDVHQRTAIEVKSGLGISNIASRVMGVIDAQYLDKIKADTHRGLLGRFERGLATGCVAHGYRTEPVLNGSVDAHGHPVPEGYRIVIHEPEAQVVRRIFDLYIGGEGLTNLARRLNREHVPPPKARGHRGGSWSPSALRGMLVNSIYKGERVWNIMGSVKDRRTGKRRRFERPESERKRMAAPELAIVSPAVWERAREIREQRAERVKRRPDGVIRGGAKKQRSRGKHVLSGLLECECSASFIAVYRDRWGCAWNAKRGPEACSNGLRIPQSHLEAQVLGTLGAALTAERLMEQIEQAASARAAEALEAQPRSARATALRRRSPPGSGRPGRSRPGSSPPPRSTGTPW
jgi:DNA invertase Pin-like site-specific DNA recombinase